jgi:NADP-dependent 3-hydroxy acid dehydrogenase YdfG
MKIFLTGGSSGIGRCLADSLSDQQDLTAPPRSRLDLSEYPSGIDLAPYDIMILSAGSDVGGRRPFMSMDDWQWQNTLQVNLLSNMQLIKDFVSVRANQWSKIIMIGSATTDYLRENMLPYTVSKLALEQFCRGLRQEIDPVIGISILRPGLVRTNFHRARHQNLMSVQECDQWYDSQNCLRPEDLIPVIESVIQDRAHCLREIVVSNGFTGAGTI